MVELDLFSLPVKIEGDVDDGRDLHEQSLPLSLVSRLTDSDDNAGCNVAASAATDDGDDGFLLLCRRRRRRMGSVAGD